MSPASAARHGTANDKTKTRNGKIIEIAPSGHLSKSVLANQVF